MEPNKKVKLNYKFTKLLMEATSDLLEEMDKAPEAERANLYSLFTSLQEMGKFFIQTYFEASEVEQAILIKEFKEAILDLEVGTKNIELEVLKETELNSILYKGNKKVEA